MHIESHSVFEVVQWYWYEQESTQKAFPLTTSTDKINQILLTGELKLFWVADSTLTCITQGLKKYMLCSAYTTYLSFQS